MAFVLSGIGLTANVLGDNLRTPGTRVTQLAADKDFVYTMGSGSKYHKAGCRYLKKKKKVKMTKAAAKKAGFTACKVCKP
jgi:hypothetical protein